MIYELNKIVNISKFETEIRTSSITTELINVTVFGEVSHADFNGELTESELTTLQDLTDNHIAVCLTQTKLNKLEQLDLDTREYILSKYNLERQNSLALIRGDARADGLTNRFTYINQVVTWTNSVLGYHYYLSDQINACVNIEDIDAIEFDFPNNTLTDPEVSIRAALAITD